jgi:hypothetical protein
MAPEAHGGNERLSDENTKSATVKQEGDEALAALRRLLNRLGGLIAGIGVGLFIVGLTLGYLISRYGHLGPAVFSIIVLSAVGLGLHYAWRLEDRKLRADEERWNLGAETSDGVGLRTLALERMPHWSVLASRIKDSIAWLSILILLPVGSALTGLVPEALRADYQGNPLGGVGLIGLTVACVACFVLVAWVWRPVERLATRVREATERVAASAMPRFPESQGVDGAPPQGVTASPAAEPREEGALLSLYEGIARLSGKVEADLEAETRRVRTAFTIFIAIPLALVGGFYLLILLTFPLPLGSILVVSLLIGAVGALIIGAAWAGFRKIRKELEQGEREMPAPSQPGGALPLLGSNVVERGMRDVGRASSRIARAKQFVEWTAVLIFFMGSFGGGFLVAPVQQALMLFLDDGAAGFTAIGVVYGVLFFLTVGYWQRGLRRFKGAEERNRAAAEALARLEREFWARF